MLEHIFHHHRGFNPILKITFILLCFEVISLLLLDLKTILRKTCIFILLLYDNITLASHLHWS